MPSTTVIRFGDRVAVWPYRALPSGHHVGGVHAVVLSWTASDEELGLAVRHGLEVARLPTAEEGAADTAPLARALGAVMFGALELEGRAVSVEPAGEGCEVAPMVSLGLGKGFAPLNLALQRATLDLEPLGAAVRQAMTMADEQARFDKALDAEDAADEARQARYARSPDAGADAGSGAPDDDEALIADLRRAAEWVAGGLNASGYTADWSLESLAELDRFFDEQTRKPGKPKRRGLLAEDLGTRLFALGGYVGEVLIRHVGGEWLPGTSELDVELELPGGSVVWPVRRVIARFEEGPENELAGYGAWLAREARQASARDGSGPASR